MNLKSMTWDEQMNLARRTDTSSETLSELSNSLEHDVLMQVVLHPNCPLEVLEKLSRHHSDRVRGMVSFSCNVTENILKRLASDGCTLVAYDAVNSAAATTETYLVLRAIQFQRGNNRAYGTPF